MSEGILSQISLGAESVVGTAVVPTVSVPVLPSDGVKIEEEAVGVNAIDTSPALNKDFVKGVREYNGAFEMNAYPQAIGYVLNSALGTDAPTLVASETTVYKHTITEAVTKPSVTIEQKIGTITNRFAGFIASGFTLTIEKGQPVKFAFNGKGMSVASATAITASYETSKVFDWTDVVSITLGGTDVKDAIESITVDYTNGLQSFHGLSGDSDPAQLYVENSEATGTIKAFLDTNMANLETVFSAKTTSALVITLAGDEVIGNGSTNSLVITLPKVVLNTYTLPIDTAYVSLETNYSGAKDATNGFWIARRSP